MKNIGSRLNIYKIKKELKTTKLCEIMEVKPSGLSRILKGHRLPTTTQLLRLLEKTDINVHWLLLGEGEMVCAKRNFSRENDMKSAVADEQIVFTNGDLLDLVEMVTKDVVNDNKAESDNINEGDMLTKVKLIHSLSQFRKKANK